MEMEEEIRRRSLLRVSNSRRNLVARVRRFQKPRDGPPPPGSIDAFQASKGFTPQPIHPVGYENMDPAILAFIPQRIRTGSGPTSETLGPFPTLSAVIAATTGYRAQVNKDLGNSLLVDTLKLEDIHITNSTHASTSTN